MITLKRANPEAVRYACINFHYAKSVPQTRWAYNVYSGDEWCGCVVFGDGATHGLAHSVGYDYGEIAELERVALNGKQAYTSEVVAAALTRIHKDAPQLKAIVSFADANQGHCGTIYQATNWIYLGQASRNVDAFIINGKRMHRRSVGARGWKQQLKWLQENVDSNAEEVRGLQKHKYLYVFDKKERKRRMKAGLAYPKKNDEKNGINRIN